MFLLNREIKKLSSDYNQLKSKVEILQGRLEDIFDESEKKIIIDRIEDHDCKLKLFKYNTYAKAIFERFSQKQPMLIDWNKSEIKKWDEIFPDKYECLTQEQKDDIVSLVEDEDGNYLLK